jgi:ribosome maturation factor RimP
LENLISQYLKGQGLELVELIYRSEGQGSVLRILADRPEGGITLGECAVLNSRIGEILDEEDIIKERYTLEISSPGLDRPLKTRSDFLRNLNKKVTVLLREPVNEKWEYQGAVKEAKEDSVDIETDKGVVEIPLSKISKAKQAIG